MARLRRTSKTKKGCPYGARKKVWHCSTKKSPSRKWKRQDRRTRRALCKGTGRWVKGYKRADGVRVKGYCVRKK